MRRAIRRLAQFACLAAIGALVGWFSVAPGYTHRPADLAEVKLSFTHGGIRADCRRRTAEELARLPPQMRRPTECQRTRPTLHLVFRMDEATLLDALLPPSGLSGDGPSRIYRAFPVHAGAHRISLFLRDSDRDTGFDHTFERDIALEPGQNLVIDFSPTGGGFYLR
ncbi:MAG TPA: hypothetical protein VH855_27945 [Acetobacteraceae bacterium]|jgi:hypothetical protein